MDPIHCVLLMVAVDSRDSLDDACVVDKSQRFGSNGSSKQHDVGQMLVRLADAFVHKPLHTVPVDWRPADEPHVAFAFDYWPKVDVYVSLAEATVVGCKLDAVVHGRNGADSCLLASLG
jgi:hypothetical protein